MAAVAPTSAPALAEIGARRSTADYLRLLWARRDFVAAVPMGELRAQNQNTVLGNLWHLFNPLLLAGVYFVVFGILFGQNRSGGDFRYLPYLVTGVFAFTFLNKSVMSGARAVTSNLGLIRQVSFPRAALPLSAVIVETLSQGFAVAALVPIILLGGGEFRWTWFLLPLVIVLQALFNLGFAFLAARASFHFRDVLQFLPYVFRLWMYLSGIMFQLSLVLDKAADHHVEWIGTLFQWNPAWLFISLWRDVMVGEIGGPLHRAPGWYWLAAVGWTLVILPLGFAWFRAHENEYAGG